MEPQFFNRGNGNVRTDGHAEFERGLLKEPVKAGVAAYRQKNETWGRPATAQAKSDDVLQLKKEKLSNRKIAEQLGMNESSVRRILLNQ